MSAQLQRGSQEDPVLVAKGIYLYVSLRGDAVSPKKAYTLKMDPELIAALREIKARDGISESEQIRRGIQLWLESKGFTRHRRAERKRAVTRKRP